MNEKFHAKILNENRILDKSFLFSNKPSSQAVKYLRTEFIANEIIISFNFHYKIVGFQKIQAPNLQQFSCLCIFTMPCDSAKDDDFQFCPTMAFKKRMGLK